MTTQAQTHIWKTYQIILTVKNLRLEVLFKQEEPTNTGYKQIFLLKNILNKNLGTNAFGKISIKILRLRKNSIVDVLDLYMS